MASTINASTSAGLVQTADTSGVLQLQTANTTALTIDASQNITAVGNIRLNNGAADGAQFILASNGYSDWNLDNYSGRLRAYYNATEYFIIDSSGNLKFNSGYGSVATAYGCRAWCNFDGTLTGTITPRANGGVTSVTKNATGDYTVNLAFTMPDINYSVSLVGNGAYGVDRSCHPAIFTNISAATEATPTTTSFKVGFSNAAGGAGQDLKYITVAVFR